MLQYAPYRNRRLVYFLLTVGLLNCLYIAGWWIAIHWEIHSGRKASDCKSDWQYLDYSPKTSRFELSFVAHVANGGRGIGRSADRRIRSQHILMRPSRQQNYTFAEMAEIEDDNWRLPIPSSVFMLYPQALDMKQVVTNITSCGSIPEAPIFNQTIRFFNISWTVCVPGKAVKEVLDAIVVVKSAVYNFAVRDRIRRTYAKEVKREHAFRMAMVFSVGLPRSSGGRYFQRDGLNISLPGQAGESLEKMRYDGPTVLRKLAEEARLNGDLLLGDYEDTYYNLSLKLFHSFQWASRFCSPHFASQQRPPVFILLDDDYAFNATILKTELMALSDTQIRRVTWGMLQMWSPVYRPLVSPGFEKWILSKRQMPWPYFAPYASGAFLVIGADILKEIALAMYFTLQFPVDDVWLGMVMTKLNVCVEPRPSMHISWPGEVRKELVSFAPLDYLFG
nr:unnamed protein product [Spirometra erinaceieuropaei]